MEFCGNRGVRPRKLEGAKGNRRVASNSLVYHSMDDQSRGKISLYRSFNKTFIRAIFEIIPEDGSFV